MDFVVAGFGLGAVLMLVGFAVRDLGQLWNRGKRDETAARAWTTLCRQVGAMIVAGGFAVCSVTLLLLLAGVGDDTGAFLVAVVSAAAVIASGVGSMLTIRRFAEAQGALRPRYGGERGAERYEPAARSGRSLRRPAWRLPEVETAGDDAVAAPDRAAEVEPSEGGLEEGVAVAAGPVMEEGPRSSPAQVFVSPLLADVANGVSTANGSGFRSSLLADLPAEGNRAGDFASSMLADVTSGGGERGESEAVIGPPAPVGLDEGGEEKPNAQAGGEARSEPVDADAKPRDGDGAEDDKEKVTGAPAKVP